MRRLKEHARSIVLLTLVVALAAVTVTRAGTFAVADGSAPVTVVNTPLPVTLTGTGKIAGTVAATQSGAWNVGVTSLPPLQLAAGTTVGISGFSNTEATALFTSDVDFAARHAFAAVLPSTPDGLSLPFGKRFVIEQVSGSCSIATVSQTLGNPRLFASLGGQVFEYAIPGQIEGEGTRRINQHVRIYADGGVVNGLFYDSGQDETCTLTASGYLVQL
jgi:hypothetical protein